MDLIEKGLLEAKTGDGMILDIRNLGEWKMEGGFKVSRCMSYGDLGRVFGDNRNYSTFKEYQKIYVMCKRGNRSLTTTSWLRRKGWTNVENVYGGTDWMKETDERA